jgi:hypothetical protein
MIVLSSLLTPETESAPTVTRVLRTRIYKHCCLFISIPAIPHRLPHTASMDKTITVPILSQYFENRKHPTSESYTVARQIRDIVLSYMLILIITIFSVPIGHGVLHNFDQYQHASIPSSFKVGAVGGSVICTAIHVLCILWNLIKHGYLSSKPKKYPLIVVVSSLIIMFLLLSFGAGAAGGAIVNHFAQVLHVREAMAAATLGCFLIEVTFAVIIIVGALLFACMRFVWEFLPLSV